MKASISNIAWDTEQDNEMYAFLSAAGYDGVEIAPPHIFGEDPYERKNEAAEVRKRLKEVYNLEISSMQSIWFGRSEKLFEDSAQREVLLDYTKRAIEFANILGCRNLVFGSPKNRNIVSETDYEVALDFFRTLGEYAWQNETVLAMEANPAIYHTNFINSTKQAFDLARQVSSAGFKVNLDIGTMIENRETVGDFVDCLDLVNHVHVSEPYLVPVQFGELQKEVISFFEKMQYQNYISIEMSNVHDIEKVKEIAGRLLKLT